MTLSVIIPTINEEVYIRSSLKSVRKLNPLEIIVVDGGSTDGTVKAAEGEGARVISSPRGRGIQLMRGASAARGDILLFLHADARLSGAVDISQYLKQGYIGGFFRLRFDEETFSIRLVEIFANLRARLFCLPYGDQAIFVRRDVFDRIGGFKNYPFLEDIDFILRLKREGKLAEVPVSVTVSSRRLKKGLPFSPVLVSLRNVLIACAFLAGISPFKLIKFYK